MLEFRPGGRIRWAGSTKMRSWRARIAVPVIRFRSGLTEAGISQAHPGSPLSAALDGLVIGIVVLGLGCSLIAAVWMGLRRIIFNHNTRAWEREWARVGPEWTSQRPT